MEKVWMTAWMEKNESYFRSIGRRLWEYAETGLEEEKSAALLCEALREQGFEVETGLAGIPTAFSGSFGCGSPVIGILGEFDALEGLSQEAGKAQRQMRAGNENGHGCGHNLLGAGSLAAAVALRDYLRESGAAGTVRYFGCPGEEYGCGKVYMARAGCFSSLDAALTWHPMDVNRVEERSSLADLCFTFHFSGRSSHASVCPHLGRSALDAVELLNVACNFMREHMIPEARIHYAITDAGGSAPNIVPSEAGVTYEVRAPRLDQAEELRERIVKAAQGAALMTETRVEVEFGDGYSDYIPNNTLNKVMWEKLIEAGVPGFDRAERELAGRIRETFGEKEGPALDTGILPLAGPGGCMAASTDVGDVSYIVPTAQLYMACCAVGTPSHSWQMVSQAGSSIGETGMIAAARVLAFTAAELFHNPELVRQAKEEHSHSVGGRYICPIAPGREPAVPQKK